jgi:hypothetical protein
MLSFLHGFNSKSESGALTNIRSRKYFRFNPNPCHQNYQSLILGQPPIARLGFRQVMPSNLAVPQYKSLKVFPAWHGVLGGGSESGALKAINVLEISGFGE